MDKAIIISSHILPDIEDISDHIGIMEAGHLVVQGNLETLQTQNATQHRTVRIKVPVEETNRTVELLRALPKVAACEIRDQQIMVTSDDSNSNYLLAALLRADIRVLQFAENEVNLEDIFMRSTAGKVT